MPRNRLQKITALLCALTCAGTFAGCAASGNKTGTGAAEELVKPELEKTAALPDAGLYDETKEYSETELQKIYEEAETALEAFYENIDERRDAIEGKQDGLFAYLKPSLSAFLKSDDNENHIYSPVNTWLALAMLAETSDGETRGQLLEILGADSIETLRDQAKGVFIGNYFDSTSNVCLPAASIWLSADHSYNQDTLNTLAEYYFASGFSGTFGAADYDAMLQDWLNTQTGGMLEDYVSAEKFDSETIMALATTLYYKAGWSDTFDETDNTEGTFHAASGDTTCTFMNDTDEGTYYYADHFSAVARSLDDFGTMWFLLPDEGTSVYDLLTDEQAISMLTLEYGDENEIVPSKYLMINESIPKFDVSSDTDLTEGMKAMGITDVFDAEKADFSPVLSDGSSGIFLSKAAHAARVKIDEEGVEAGSFTMFGMAGAAMPPDDEVDFVLDRPFLFCISGDSQTPLFIGIVNNAE